MSKNVLVIKSSPAQSSLSSEMADYLIARLEARNEQVNIKIRDLAAAPIAPLSDDTIKAFYTPEEQLSPLQASLVAPSLTLIDELKQADTLVIASAMHNFSIPGLLKTYIDQICRVGLTFKYDENGAQGLLKNKNAILISSAGMDFQQDFAKDMDFQSPYLMHILNFIGIENITLVPVQGMAMGNEDGIKARAKAQIAELVAA